MSTCVQLPRAFTANVIFVHWLIIAKAVWLNDLQAKLTIVDREL